MLAQYALSEGSPNKPWLYKCKRCCHIKYFDVPTIQARCANRNTLLQSILKIKDISKLIACLSSFRVKISVPYTCAICSWSFNVNVLVRCNGVVRSSLLSYSKIRSIKEIDIVQILPQSEHLDFSWNDVIQDESHKFFKCRKGHTALLAWDDIYDENKNFLDGINTVSLERKCHRCDCLYNVSIHPRNIILSRGAGADINLYKCHTSGCKQVNLFSTRDFKRVHFSHLKMSKVSGIKTFIEDHGRYELYYRTKYDSKCKSCSAKLEVKLREEQVNVGIEYWNAVEVLPQHSILYQNKLANCLELHDGDQLYQCESCSRYEIITGLSLNESDLDLDCEISNALMEIENSSGPLIWGRYLATVKIHLKHPCSCIRCKRYILVSVEVQPGSIGWEHAPYHRMPSVERFHDNEVVRILEQGSPVDSSLLDCMADDDQETDEDDYSFLDDYQTIENIERPELKPYVSEMVIFVKTKMNKGFCYLGLDTDRSLILRPIATYEEHCCCWSGGMEMELDTKYRFLVFSESEPETPFPHHNNDVQVSTYKTKVDGNIGSIYQLLSNLARSKVKDLFKESNDSEETTIQEKKYIHEGTDCQSAGVLWCKGKDLWFYQKKGSHNIMKDRVQITDGDGEKYDMRYTGIEQLPRSEEIGYDEDVLVVLGLARPWPGKKKEYNPLRCYLLALRVIQQPKDTQEELCQNFTSTLSL